MTAIIDWNNCLQMANNNQDIAKDLLKMLVEELPISTQELQQAFDQDDFANMLYISHRLHGAACYCSVPFLKDAAQTLEQFIKNNDKPDKSQVEQMLTNLLNASKDVQDAFQQLTTP